MIAADKEARQRPHAITGENAMNITQGLRRVLQTNPQAIATIDGDRRRNWREVGDRVARLAGGCRTSASSPATASRC